MADIQKENLKKEIILSRNNNIIPRPFRPPVLAKEEWCDFRIDYETGMTLKEIAAKYICDPRTVRKCILMNRSRLRRKKTTARKSSP